MIRAKVIGWTDAGQADRFEDEHGFEWKYAVDAADGTIAIERMDGRMAGVFSWESGADAGSIVIADDGFTYGVSNPGEYIAKDGEWWLLNDLKKEGN